MEAGIGVKPSWVKKSWGQLQLREARDGCSPPASTGRKARLTPWHCANEADSRHPAFRTAREYVYVASIMMPSMLVTTPQRATSWHGVGWQVALCSLTDFWRNSPLEQPIKGKEVRNLSADCIIQPLETTQETPFQTPRPAFHVNADMEELLSATRTQHVFRETHANLNPQLWF